jgi:hypothetical protein
MTRAPSVRGALAAALALGERGFPCFPCASTKVPATPHGFKDASRDREVLEQLWQRHPGPLVGVVTGERSGMSVLDIDPRHGGERWFFGNGERLPITRAHGTRSGGVHLLFQHRTGLKCSAGKIAVGVDVRADGGYVIWWPAAGILQLSMAAPAPWPDWLGTEPARSDRRPSHRVVVADDERFRRLVRLVAAAGPGERNNLTFWAACRAGEMVSSGLLREETAVDVIAEAATRAGLPLPEAERTAWSGIRTTRGGSHA